MQACHKPSYVVPALQYYSTVDLVPHQYSGLVGVVAIGRMGTFAADGAQPTAAHAQQWHALTPAHSAARTSARLDDC
jgi:hypothetical protein